MKYQSLLSSSIRISTFANLINWNIILLLFFTSCKTENRYIKNVYPIINSIIFDLGGPMIPPSKKYVADSPYNERDIDSIKKSNQLVRVYPVVENEFYEKIDLDTLKNEFKEVLVKYNSIKNLKSESFIIDTSYLQFPENYKLRLLDTIAKNKDRRYLEKNGMVMVKITNIIFDDSFKKAIVIAGAARSHLDGFSSLILFKKINGVWYEVYSKTLEIS